MFRTMSLLRALIGTSRMVRHAPRLAAALTPDDDVLLDAPDGRLAPALVAAALDDPEPAAKLLATTRDAAEWEERDRYVTRLSAFAYRRDGWLEHWLSAAPHDPDALLVTAQLAVRRAWESPARAERLRELGPLIEAAAEAAPRDPVPWRLALDHARGTHAGHTVFEALWEQAVRRAPHHYGSHVAALKYLSAQWYGSHRECFDFAEQAAEDALPGSLAQALPVRAAFAQLLAAPGREHGVRAGRIDAAADRALALSAEYPAGALWPAEVRNLLVRVLVERGRWHDALAEFGRIGPQASTFPWTLVAEDPLHGFLEARARTVREAARRIPLGAAAGPAA
ncbi:hypothetical protein [Streptomyces roseicoloratus]|uniref:DUF4034 domain-containing protein n=1 Tax=Streptomyces roseicoloratus TaxID=2508722 RepID=A0ABY9RZW1_9ACTN|nr:hypothetical protein [Streptomyces roseicoloratus]WMX47537.1 hypothetical protein RGF97_25745 [Streptomyces roseicoloratus]